MPSWLDLGVCATDGVCDESANLRASTDFTGDDARYEPEEIACDGLDNDCDGLTDDGLFGPGCEPKGCIPECDRRECGPDGCGWNCGTCEGNRTCSSAGKCECRPGFAGAACDTCDYGYTGFPDCHREALQVSAGFYRTCALYRGGVVKCWGDGNWNAFGDGTTLDRSTPGDIATGGAATEISATGDGFACARLEDGSAQCWGETVRKVDVDALDAPLRYDIPISVESGVISVAAGTTHACVALLDGRVKCWGLRTCTWPDCKPDYELWFSRTPVEIPSLSDAKSVVAGEEFTCALLNGGGVKCWGHDSDGQTGNGHLSADASPQWVVGLETGVEKISAGRDHACALLKNGEVKCWGRCYDLSCGRDPYQEAVSAFRNPRDKTGLGKETIFSCSGATSNCGTLTMDHAGAVPNPVNVYGLDNQAIDVCAGGGHSCAVLRDGRVACWGNNHFGQLGRKTQDWDKTAMPVRVEGLCGPATSVSCGHFHTCAVLNDGRIQCWGDDSEGELGQGAPQNSRVPMKVPGLDEAVSTVAVGSDFACAIGDSGQVWCWGSNLDGQLGRSVVDTYGESPLMWSGPIVVSGLPAEPVELGAGTRHTCAILSNGHGYCWGSSTHGQAMPGAQNEGPAFPPILDLSDESVASMSASGYTSCAVLKKGEIWCWGLNSFEPGRDYDVIRASLIPGPSDAVQVSGDYNRQCYLDKSGSVFCWSTQTDPDSIYSRTPKVPLKGVGKYLSSGTGFACVLTDDHRVECWGEGRTGRFGEGLPAYRKVPEYVAGLGGPAAALSCGGQHCCVILDSGRVQCWGANDSGQIGDGTLVARPRPTWVTGLGGTARSISAGPRQTCAVISDGTVRCWGHNDHNELLTGGDSFSSSPVTVAN